MINFDKWDMWTNEQANYVEDCGFVPKLLITISDIWLDLYDENNIKKTIVSLGMSEVL